MPSPTNLPLILFLLFNLFIHHQSLAAKTKQKRCHPDDENGLLSFKSWIKSDQSGIFNSWKRGTYCCRWYGVQCKPEANYRVTTIDLQGWPDQNANVLGGPISPSLSKLRSLEVFSLAHLGNLTGPFPKFLLTLPNITTIVISDSKLSGPLPRNLTNLAKLKTLNLQGNQFSGRIPSLGKYTGLVDLNLANNRLSGGIPLTFRRLRKLFRMDLGWNQLTGTIPDFFDVLTGVGVLYLSHNQFSGNIPKTLSYLQPLNVDLSHNNLTGPIPDIYSERFNSINQFDLSWNQLSGDIPEGFSKFTQVKLLDFSHNKLNGSVPQMGYWGPLYKIDLSYNDFHFGEIPEWVGNTSMMILGLSKCGIKMKLNDWKQTVSYGEVYLSDNELTGDPLEFLNSHSIWTGAFPFTTLWAAGNKLKFDMKDLKFGEEMVSLDLSNNLIYGNVPEIVSSLQQLNVSHNHLCGQLPPTNFTASAFLDNDCLCGAPLPPCKS